MLSSKVLRINDLQDLKRIQFREFGSEGADEQSWVVAEPAGAGHPETAEEAFPAQDAVPVATPPDLEEQLAVAYRQGREAALQEERERLGSAADMLAQVLDEVTRLRGSLLRNSSHDMLRLVMSVARQVIHCEVRSDPQIILTTIERAMRAAVQADSYHIRVHPDDLARVAEHKPLFLAGISGLQNLTMQGDPAIARGGCLVESEFGEVDATIDSQLEEIRRNLLATLDQP
jgi:Flagellar biosynthesis/type III secretory pathway protein